MASITLTLTKYELNVIQQALYNLKGESEDRANKAVLDNRRNLNNPPLTDEQIEVLQARAEKHAEIESKIYELYKEFKVHS